MATLTHVCMWQKSGWKPISASEASTIHPGGTVSAHSGLFMCGLCGQYVLLTDGDKQVKHFRHSSKEKSKDCPDRSLGSPFGYSYDANEHELPLKIEGMSKDRFNLKIGFVRVPANLLTKDLRVEIQSASFSDRRFVYSHERFNLDTITYLSVGNVPAAKYEIVLKGAANNLRQYWPKHVRGIEADGTVFNAETGIRLEYDADVCVGKKYYIVKRGKIYDSHNGISIKEVSVLTSQQTSWYEIKTSWYVYAVSANNMEEQAARFFLNFHCRLSERPGSIQVVWPICVQKHYLIEYNRGSVVLYVTGYQTTQSFPKVQIESFSCNGGMVLDVSANERQQLISAGRARALEYTYLWKEPIQHTSSRPGIVITDVDHNPVQAGESNELPKDRSLLFSTPYDGMLEVRSHDVLRERRKLHDNQLNILDNLAFGIEIQLYVGIDCVWMKSYAAKRFDASSHEAALLRKLRQASGALISVPHTIGGVMIHFQKYPLLRQWIYACVRNGTIRNEAYMILRAEIVDEQMKG